MAIISANAEWRVVRELHPNLKIERSPFGESAVLSLDGRTLRIFHGGWGKISAAASAQYVIDHYKPDLLLNLGTCGGFAGHVQIGTILLVERTLVYDILEQMGDTAAAIEHYTTLLDLHWLPDPLPHRVLRGPLVSADRDLLASDIRDLIERYGAIAADWESGAIAWVASRNKIPCLILRGVSDLVTADGGEAYGNLELFHERTKGIMQELFHELQDWLDAAEGGLERKAATETRARSDA